MNRMEARQFAEAWAVDARVLLEAGRWHAAYYLAGYAVECRLKACVLVYVDNSGIIFQDKKFAEKCFTHDLEALVKTADLQEAFGRAIAANPDSERNWDIVKGWNVDIRYQERNEAKARRLYGAVTDNANGVFPWIRTRW